MTMKNVKPISNFKNKLVDFEKAFDAADFDAKNNPTRYTHEEVFNSIRNKLKNHLTDHHLH